MKKPEEEFKLHIQPRPTEIVSLEIPKDTLESLNRVAASRDMSLQALLKFYIGQGLRQDIAKLFGDRVLETAAEVLAKHIQKKFLQLCEKFEFQRLISSVSARVSPLKKAPNRQTSF
jgi:hypothetical protein